MYRKIEPELRMTCNEACVLYKDDFILMRMDSISPFNDNGTVLYVGDEYEELYSVIDTFEDDMNCGVIEGQNHRRSLGGVVIGG